MQFLGNFGKIVCWRPPPGSWRPLLGEILDPPLILAYFMNLVWNNELNIFKGYPEVIIPIFPFNNFRVLRYAQSIIELMT